MPATLSRVTINVNDRVGGDNRVVALHAGLVGVAQDHDGALRPVAGWRLVPAVVEIDDVIDRICRDHVVAPPEPTPPLYEAPAEAVALYRRIGSASLFGGSWRLLPVTEHRHVWRGPGHRPIETVIDLADGRSISAVPDHETQTTHWAICRVEQVTADRPDQSDRGYRLVGDPADVPVYGTSLALLLDAALDSGGDITHLETGRLDEWDASTS